MEIKMKNLQKKTACVVGLIMMLATPAFASEQTTEKTTYELTIKEHRFEPSEIKIPADKPAILHIKNLDAEAEEFESHDLKIEKVISGKGEGTIHLRALKAGRYEFEGEYHSKSAQGVLIAE
jgi:plastocyanin